MSGFLRRLAKQAMGLAAPVRSAARLPYAATYGSVEQAEERAPVQVPGFAPAASQRGASWVNVPRRSYPLESTERATPARDPSEGTEMPRLQEELPSVAGKQMTAVPEARLAVQASGRAASTPARRTPVDANAAAVREDVPIAPPVAREPIAGAEASAEDLLPAPTVFAEAALPLQPPARRSPRDRAPMLPRRSIATSAPQVSAERRGLVEETTEVHVNIGRIEVTAVHEAPPSKRPITRASKPMSLEEYLARRRGGRP